MMIDLVSISGTPRLNNKAVDLPLAYLRNKGYKVKAHYYHGTHQVNDVLNLINGFKSRVIAINITVYNLDEVIYLVNNMKSNNNVVVVFGEFVTQFYKEIFEKTNNINFALLGDLELPLEALLASQFNYDALEKYRSSIATPNHLDNKEPIYNYDYYLPAFDYLKQLLPNRRKRVEYIMQTKNAVCTGKCTFCRSMKGEIVFRKIDELIKEILIVTKKYGVQKIFFTDDNILDGGAPAVERLHELCDLIISNKIKAAFKCYFKATSCYDEALLKKMKQAGFTTIFVGLESGDQEDLLLYNKLTTVTQNNRVMKDLKGNGIFPQVGFLTFNPYTTLDKLKNNYYFLLKHEIDDLFMWVSSVRIFKYTPMYNYAKKDGLLFDDEEYISYKCRYFLEDEKAQQIYNFVMDKMYERIYKLSYDFEYMYGFYLDVLQTHKKALPYKKKLLEYKTSQISRIKDFFYHLYVEGDLDYANSHYDEFLMSFETDQVELGKLYDDLLTIYIE